MSAKEAILAAIVLLSAAVMAQPTAKVGMYGDSTVWGTTYVNGSYVQSAHNVPVSVEWSLHSTYGYGSNVSVENKGVPGASCPDLLWGNPSKQKQADGVTPIYQDPNGAVVPQSWDEQMAASTADIVTMTIGINDSFKPYILKSDFEWCLQQMVFKARAKGKIIAFITPNPIADVHNSPELEARVNSMKTVATQLNVPVADNWTAVQQSVNNWQSYLPDLIHPNDNLYMYMAQVATPTVWPLVAQVLAR